MAEEDAVKRLGIAPKVWKRFKKEACPLNIHLEHGKNVTAPNIYKKFLFVFVSPEGTIASQQHGLITLSIWCSMCDYFSKNMNTTDDDGDKHFVRYFKEYTNFDEVTPANIAAAFEKGFLKQPSKLNYTPPPKRVVTPPKKTYTNVKTNNNNSTSATNTNNNQQQQLREDSTTVHDLIPSEEQLTVVLTNRLKQLDQDDVASDEDLSKIGGLMKVAEIESLKFKADRHNSNKQRNVNMVFTLCESCGCNRVTEARQNQSTLCRKCGMQRNNAKAYEKTRQENAEMRVAPDSRVPIQKLQPDEISVRMRKLNKVRARKEQEYKRLVAKLAAYEMEKEKMSDAMSETSRKAMEYAKDNPTLLRGELSTVLYQLIEEQNNSIEGSKALSHDDVGPLVEMLVDEIKNQCRVWNDQDNQCKYSSKLLGVAMSLYLRCGRSGYEKFRDDSIMRYPSADYLAKMKQKQQISDGNCITMYEDQLKMRGSVKEEVGQLVVDEMKLRKDVIMNVSSNEIIGVTDDFLSTKKIIKSLLDTDADDIDDLNEPATYVNQWRYRSITGHTYNCEFWYNNGKLTGDALLQQFTRVVMNCEMIGSRVLGLVCDAGGNNARLFALLRESGQQFPADAWVDEDAVRTVNPFDNSRYIYLIHCATHDLKAVRNSTFESWILGGAREFLCEDGNRIGKAILDQCYERDARRLLQGTVRQTSLTKDTINLNKWSKMNVAHAKKCFEWNTLAEIADHLYNELGVTTDDGRLKKKDSKNGNKVGFMVQVAEELKTLLRKQVESGQVSSEKATSLANDVSSFEWLAHVHEIFHMRLMNMKYLVGRTTIDR